MPFEDDLGEALRRTGEGFTPDQRVLVDGGELRGRRMVARRRAAVVTGTVLAMAAVGTVGAYAGGLFGSGEGGAGGAGAVNVAAPASSSGSGTGKDASDGKGDRTVGTGAVTAEQMVATFKALVPQGGTRITDTEARGTDESPMVSGVYDDGKGRAAISLALSRIDPNSGPADQMVVCPSQAVLSFDSCTSEKLADGSRLLLFKGYEYADRRVETKVWRATLVTPQGFLLDASEWNAPADKGAPVTRPLPPLDLTQMKTLVTSDTWHPALNDLPPAPVEKPIPPMSGPVAVEVLEDLVEHGARVVDKGGEGTHGFVVLDDGKGKSLVQVSAEAGGLMGKTRAQLFGGPGVTVLPDGTRVRAEQKPGEKGGRNVVWWSVDTLRPDGRRVLVSAFNTGNQDTAATRAEPALTMEQLKQIALSPKWFH
ncbi:hypothetical protein [Streptomyces sp. NPDC089799]|uniref:hypothetical protein n=1 Tax=Streptomyces sp. NPDC089799 TaxID=3155066 RepID=UPI003420154C